MSKLDTVRAALQSNVNVQIVAAEERVYFPHPHSYWTHTVDFVVAPNRGIYAAAELQAFMESIIPGLQPTSIDQFHNFDTSMDLGKLYFDEDLGTETIRHELTLTEWDFLPDGIVNDGKVICEEERKIRRRTWVRLYPDQEVAMLRHQFPHSIPVAELRRFKARGRKVGFMGSIGRAAGH